MDYRYSALGEAVALAIAAADGWILEGDDIYSVVAEPEGRLAHWWILGQAAIAAMAAKMPPEDIKIQAATALALGRIGQGDFLSIMDGSIGEDSADLFNACWGDDRLRLLADWLKDRTD
jgi:hypothetical protein